MATLHGDSCFPDGIRRRGRSREGGRKQFYAILHSHTGQFCSISCRHQSVLFPVNLPHDTLRFQAFTLKIPIDRSMSPVSLSRLTPSCVDVAQWKLEPRATLATETHLRHKYLRSRSERTDPAV